MVDRVMINYPQDYRECLEREYNIGKDGYMNFVDSTAHLEELKPYDGRRFACPKCTHINRHEVIYSNNWFFLEDKRINDERMTLTCMICGFKSQRRPVDWKSKSDDD